MREKLIELLTTGKRRCWDGECTECEYDDIDPICQSKLIADYLIKNGVVIPVRCGECKFLETSGTWEDGISDECGLDIISDIDDIDTSYCHYGKPKEGEKE